MSLNWGSMTKKQQESINEMLREDAIEDEKATTKMLKTFCVLCLWIGFMYVALYWVLIHSSYAVQH